MPKLVVTCGLLEESSWELTGWSAAILGINEEDERGVVVG
jgi:hypothetical protein